MEVQSYTEHPLIEKAICHLKEAEKEKPLNLKEDIREAQLCLTELRDRLIKDLREEESPVNKNNLEQVNSILSLIFGIEYPVGGIERQKIQKAEEAIGKLIKV